VPARCARLRARDAALQTAAQGCPLPLNASRDVRFAQRVGFSVVHGARASGTAHAMSFKSCTGKRSPDRLASHVLTVAHLRLYFQLTSAGVEPRLAECCSGLGARPRF
jgi:hypothetical protein